MATNLFVGSSQTSHNADARRCAAQRAGTSGCSSVRSTVTAGTGPAAAEAPLVGRVGGSRRARQRPLIPQRRRRGPMWRRRRRG